MATAALISQELEISRVGSAVSNAGGYWTVTQFQIAHLQLKQELRAIAAGEAAREDVLKQRAAVLASKASILTEPSDVRRQLESVPGYGEASRHMATVQARIGAALDRSPFTQADAAMVLAELQSAGDEEQLIELVNNVRQSEIAGKEVVLRGLTLRNRWAWAGFALCWTGLALWLVYAVRSRRLYQAAARDRQRAVDAMERALSAKRKFLSMVNHEVRSPLQSIMAAAEQLASNDASAGPERPDNTPAIRRIRHAVSALQGQLRDLLTIARGEAEQLSTHAETFEFRALVQDVCADQQEAALAKDLGFHVVVPTKPVTVHADPIRIAQILRNLVENAVRYTDDGRVDVRLELQDGPDVQAGPAEQAGQVDLVRLIVEDTGPGLPASALERLQREAVPFDANESGTGIGLFVVRDLLQQLGGRVEVSQVDGRGSRFVVSIPVAWVDDSAIEEPATDALKVLIVDDRDDVLTALGDITRGLGHRCWTAGSSAAAQELLGSDHYDTVLIDLEMPGQDGLGLATAIRQGGGPNRDAMLILISAAENLSVGQQWPFDGFLQKPIDAPALIQLIGSRTPR